MANVLHQRRTRITNFPGLPYDNTFTHSEGVIVDSVPEMGELEQILHQARKDTILNPWTVYTLRNLQTYTPTTYRQITRGFQENLLDDYTPNESKGINERKRILLQLQTELNTKSSTVDAALIHARRDLGTVTSKAHTVLRLYSIGRSWSFFEPNEQFEGYITGKGPFFFGDLTQPNNWDNALLQVKELFIDLLEKIPVGDRPCEKIIKKTDVSDAELQNRFGYVEWLKEKLGDNLAGVLLYGSAAKTDDPKKHSDFDNWVRVHDLRKAQQVLKNTCPVVIDNKVVELPPGMAEPVGSKHLGLNLFSASEKYALNYIRFLHDPVEFLLHGKVIYGDFPFVKVEQDEVVERGVSQSLIKLRTIAGSLNWAYQTPERIYGKPSLFEFVVKNIRFFYQHSLNATEGPQMRTKEELNERLAQKGLHVPEYRDDLRHIQESLLYSWRAVSQLQQEFILANKWKPSMSFLGNVPNIPQMPKANMYASFE